MGKTQPEGTLEEHTRLEVGNITLTSNIIIPLAGDCTSVHKMRSRLSSSAEEEMRKKSTPENEKIMLQLTRERKKVKGKKQNGLKLMKITM